MNIMVSAMKMPALNPDELQPGQMIRRGENGRKCCVESIADDRRKVLVRDVSLCIWVKMDTIVRNWQ